MGGPGNTVSEQCGLGKILHTRRLAAMVSTYDYRGSVAIILSQETGEVIVYYKGRIDYCHEVGDVSKGRHRPHYEPVRTLDNVVSGAD